MWVVEIFKYIGRNVNQKSNPDWNRRGTLLSYQIHFIHELYLEKEGKREVEMPNKTLQKQFKVAFCIRTIRLVHLHHLNNFRSMNSFANWFIALQKAIKFTWVLGDQRATHIQYGFHWLAIWRWKKGTQEFR